MEVLVYGYSVQTAEAEMKMNLLIVSFELYVKFHLIKEDIHSVS